MIFTPENLVQADDNFEFVITYQDQRLVGRFTSVLTVRKDINADKEEERKWKAVYKGLKGDFGGIKIFADEFKVTKVVLKNVRDMEVPFVAIDTILSTLADTELKTVENPKGWYIFNLRSLRKISEDLIWLDVADKNLIDFLSAQISAVEEQEQNSIEYVSWSIKDFISCFKPIYIRSLKYAV